MTQIWLFPGEQSERKQLSENQLERVKGILIAAMKQCGALWLPQLVEKPRLRDWPAFPYPAFFGDISPAAPYLSESWKRDKPKDGVLFLVGPESGFSTKEEDCLLRLEAQGVKLHSHILRTDTAALAALTQIHCLAAAS